MEAIAPRLNAHAVIGIDTAMSVYVFEDHPTYGAIASEVLTQVEEGIVSAVTSFVSLMKILVLPLRQGYPDIADAYGLLAGRFRNLDILPVSGLKTIWA